MVCPIPLNAEGEILGLNLTTQQYFTLVSYVEAPGGVATDLALWLKADSNVFTDGDAAALGTTVVVEGDEIGSWGDVSGNDNYFFDGT